MRVHGSQIKSRRYATACRVLQCTTPRQEHELGCTVVPPLTSSRALRSSMAKAPAAYAPEAPTAPGPQAPMEGRDAVALWAVCAEAARRIEMDARPHLQRTPIVDRSSSSPLPSHTLELCQLRNVSTPSQAQSKFMAVPFSHTAVAAAARDAVELAGPPWKNIFFKQPWSQVQPNHQSCQDRGVLVLSWQHHVIPFSMATLSTVCWTPSMWLMRCKPAAHHLAALI